MGDRQHVRAARLLESRQEAVTTPDVRTAAQTEADERFPETPFAPENESLAEAFIDGAVCGAAYVTPTREQIAEAIAGEEEYPHPRGYLAHADSVLELMKH